MGIEGWRIKITKKVPKGLITLLSPVTTITRMPAVMHESMAFFTSSLGGSSIPTYMSTDWIQYVKDSFRKLKYNEYNKNSYSKLTSEQLMNWTHKGPILTS